MKPIAMLVIIILTSPIICEEENLKKQENLRKFLIDLEFAEKILKMAKEAEQSAKEFFDRVQFEFEELVVGIENLKNHLDSLLAELTKIDQSLTSALHNKDKEKANAAIADENYKKAKDNLDAVKKSEDQEKNDLATKEYTISSREQHLSVEALKKAEEALNMLEAELDDIKKAVKISQDAYNEALLQKEYKQLKLAQLKENFDAKISERMKAEDEFKKAKAAIERIPDMNALRLNDKKNGAGSFGLKQIVGLFCSLLTGAVAAGLKL